MSVKEQQIEKDLIEQIVAQKYTYRPDIRDKASLAQNFRAQFEALNQVQLTDAEFSHLCDTIIQADVFAAAQWLRERNTFQRADGTPLQYTLVNIKDWCKNTFEVVNQLRMNTDNSFHRYDVMLLVNGLPLVQIELKTLEISTRRAMEQIVQYKNDPGNGYSNTLLCFVQLFIVSNRNQTYYFANNRPEHFSFNADERFLPIYQWATEDNKKVAHLQDFTAQFLGKCALGQLLSRYMVLVASEQKLLIMRPYQIYAVQAIVDCIEQNRGNGYIWHTTGSGKTLTSFKASTLLKDNPAVDKCLFVVDRKDLDRQTRAEFNKFQAGCVEENTNTETLVRRLLSTDYADKVIVTTIQKLGLALDERGARGASYRARLKPLQDKRIVFIFDECHRSQFGENHQAIRDFFPKAQLFGFTGTPIFADNATAQQIEGTVKSYKTTADIFQQQLHAYTITHAIEDRNVLRFQVDYFGGQSSPASGQAVALPPAAVVQAILDKHDAVTNQRRFNAILATASINEAIVFYDLFAQAQAERQAVDAGFRPLNVVCVFSPPAEGNKDVLQIQEDLPQESADNQEAPAEKKAALQRIIADYNARYGTNHRVAEFDLYYQDVQQRIKDQQFSNADYAHCHKIDLVIVVDMLLTGFDSKYLNTLYVAKNLKYHGLIQAFSRTNRVLNDTKPQGNILDFRLQQAAVDEAICLFSGVDRAQAKQVWLVPSAAETIGQFEAAVQQLESFMAGQGLACQPSEVANLQGDAARADFVQRFKAVQRLKLQLDQYADLDQAQVAAVEAVLPSESLRGFRASYLEVAQALREKQADPAAGESLAQLDLELVLFGSSLIDYDYIMGLLARSMGAEPSEQRVTRAQLVELVCGSANWLGERAEIVAYIEELPLGVCLDEAAIREGYEVFKAERSAEVLVALAGRHGVDAAGLQVLVDRVLDRMIFDEELLSKLFEPLGLDWRTQGRAKSALMAELVPFLKRAAAGREISGLRVWI